MTFPERELPAQLTPRQRLARSRDAITNEIGHGHAAAGSEPVDDLGPEWGQDAMKEHLKPGGKPRSGWWPVFSALAKTWWHRHPLNAVTHMAGPVIESYARKKPAKLLGIAALVGVAVVVIRPWRLISVGALLAAALRPSEISAFAMTMLSSFNSTLDQDKRQRAARGKAPPR